MTSAGLNNSPTAEGGCATSPPLPRREEGAGAVHQVSGIRLTEARSSLVRSSRVGPPGCEPEAKTREPLSRPTGWMRPERIRAEG